MAKLASSRNLDLAIRVVKNLKRSASSRTLEMGWIDAAFGNVTEKPGNIAGFAIIASFLVLVEFC